MRQMVKAFVSPPRARATASVSRPAVFQSVPAYRSRHEGTRDRPPAEAETWDSAKQLATDCRRAGATATAAIECRHAVAATAVRAPPPRETAPQTAPSIPTGAAPAPSPLPVPP